MAGMTPEGTRPALESHDDAKPDEGPRDGASLDSERERAIERIRERGERVARQERERALARLRARTDLSERDEQVVADLASSLTEELLAVPQQQLWTLSAEDGEAAAVALELFGES